MTDWALNKPQGFYLSSFRCVTKPSPTRSCAPAVSGIDGLLLQVTQRIGSIDVRHEPQRASQSTYCGA
jgi:undecaprenyl-phosphate 4-deoxy-4-formamido-L-arabinose transferase